MVMDPNQGMIDMGGGGGNSGGGGGGGGTPTSTPVVITQTPTPQSANFPTPTPTNTSTPTVRCVQSHERNKFGKRYPKIIKTTPGETFYNSFPGANAAVVKYSDGSVQVLIAEPTIPNVPIPQWEFISSEIVQEDVSLDLCGISITPTPTPTSTLTDTPTPTSTPTSTPLPTATPTSTLEVYGTEYRITPIDPGMDSNPEITWYSIGTKEWIHSTQQAGNIHEVIVCSGHVPVAPDFNIEPTGNQCKADGTVIYGASGGSGTTPTPQQRPK